jgi:putative glutamine amidotransferase
VKVQRRRRCTFFFSAMPPALIGLTASPSPDAEQPSAKSAYAQAIAAAGGLPVFLPLGLPTATLRGIFERLDGLLLPGGGDLDPSTYGITTAARLTGVDPERDRLELTLARWALQDGKPVLGICRGQQVLNVAAGGTLIPDIPSLRPDALPHADPNRAPDALAHSVTVEPDSYLAKVGTPLSLEVNSSHHQAVGRVASSWSVSAVAPDGIIEAIEWQGHPFALAVQWHPERLGGRPDAAGLFATFVQIASPG